MGGSRLDGGTPESMVRGASVVLSVVFEPWGEDIQEGGKLEAEVSQPVAPS